MWGWGQACYGAELAVGLSLLWGRAHCGAEPAVGQGPLWGRARYGAAYAGETWLEETEETWVACEEPETSSSSPKGLLPQNTSFSMHERNCGHGARRRDPRHPDP